MAIQDRDEVMSEMGKSERAVYSGASEHAEFDEGNGVSGLSPEMEARVDTLVSGYFSSMADRNEGECALVDLIRSW